jgi:hypothetical protein
MTRKKYKWRHLVENFFRAIRAFRRIATRYETTDTCFTAMVNIVAVAFSCPYTFSLATQSCKKKRPLSRHTKLQEKTSETPFYLLSSPLTVFYEVVSVLCTRRVLEWSRNDGVRRTEYVSQLLSQ